MALSVWSQHQATYSEPLYWPSSDAFVPESSQLYPGKAAWRPFELRRRICVSQDLAVLVIRPVVLLTLQEIAS